MKGGEGSKSVSGLLGRPVAGAILTVILLIFVLLRMAGWLYRVGIPVTWDYGPAQNALCVTWLRSGLSLYPDVRTWISGNFYGPASFLIAALIAPLFGHGVMAAMMAGRSLVILSTLVVSVMIFMLARGFGSSVAACLIAALAFLCSPLLQPWGFAFRVDMPALAFGVTGLWMFQAGYEFSAVIFCVVAFFTKQSSGAAMAAIVLSLWFEHRRGRAVAFVVSWALAVFAITLLLERTWPYYLLNTFTGVRQGFPDLKAAPLFLSRTLILNMALAFMALWAIFSRRANRLAILFLGMALLENLVGAIRWGSNLYYFLPTVAAMSIVAAPQFDWLIGDIARSTRGVGLLRAVVIALIILAGNFHYKRFLSHPLLSLLPTTVYHKPYDIHSLRALRSIHGLVFTDEPSLMLLDASPNLRPISLMVLEGMRSHGEFDDSEFLREIRCHGVAAFALGPEKLQLSYRGRSFFWPSLRKTIGANYAFAPTGGPPFLMLPKAVGGCRQAGSRTGER